MSAIDRRVEQVLGSTKTSVRADSSIPRRTTSVDRLAALDGSARKTPATVNPAPEELRFTPAKEAGDVAARLGAYSDPLAAPPDAPKIDLPGAWKQAQSTGREYLTSEENYILAAIRLLSEQHLWSPRLFNDTTATLGATGSAGNFDHALNIINTLRATQKLPYGGDLEARWVTNATQQLREQVTDRYQQAGELALSGNIPLLRGAGDSARESLIQSERDLIYQARDFERSRRQFLVQIAQDYFNLVNQRNRIRNQQVALESFKHINEAESARVDAGRRPAFQRNLTRNQVLTAQSVLVSQLESYRLSWDRFKIRLGLQPSANVVLSDTELSLKRPEATEDQAGALALEYRLDLQTQRDRLIDTRRGVENAKNQLLPDLAWRSSVGVPTDPNKGTGGATFDPNWLNYSSSLTLSLPLDREIERLGLRRAIIALEARQRDLARARDETYVAARSALRRIDQALFQLDLAEQAVKINESRLEEQRLKADEVEPQRIVDSQNDLLRSQNDRDQARTDAQIAILNYLLETDQLRVAPDGTMMPLPGMSEVTTPAAPLGASAQPSGAPENQAVERK